MDEQEGEEDAYKLAPAPNVSQANVEVALEVETIIAESIFASGAPKVERALSSRSTEPEQAPVVEAIVAESAPASETPLAEQASIPSESEPVSPSPMKKNTKSSVDHPMSVEALRGERGSDFESRAAVLRGVKKNFLQKWLPLFFDERDFVSYGESERFALIKGNCCFVYIDETDTTPLYSIDLDTVEPVVEDRHKPHPNSITISPSENNISKEQLTTVLLFYEDGRIAYQFTFVQENENENLAEKFVEVIRRQQCDDKKKSVLYAKEVNAIKVKCQPDDPNAPRIV